MTVTQEVPLLSASRFTPEQYALARKTLEFMAAHPEQVDMTRWLEIKCGTTACFAGWAVTLAGAQIVRIGAEDDHMVLTPEGGLMNIDDYAMDLLGMDPGTSIDVFYAFDHSAFLDEVRAMWGPEILDGIDFDQFLATHCPNEQESLKAMRA